MEIRQALETMIGFFRREEIPFVVVGAVALHGYGLSRATYDLDFLVDLEDQPRLVEFLESLGYRTLHRSAGFSNHAHPLAARGAIDVLYVQGETRDQVFASASEREVLPGVTAPVPRPEHLVAMKVHAMKNDPDRLLQEMSDIHFLMQVPGIERSEVRESFAKRGLLDRYEEIRRSLP